MTNNHNFTSLDAHALSSVTGGLFGFGTKKPTPAPTTPTPTPTPAPHNPQRQQQEINDLMLHIPSIVL